MIKGRQLAAWFLFPLPQISFLYKLIQQFRIFYVLVPVILAHAGNFCFVNVLLLQLCGKFVVENYPLKNQYFVFVRLL